MFLVSQVSGIVKNFSIGIFKCDGCQTLLDGITHLALPVHTTFIDHDHNLRSRQSHTVLTEIVMFSSDQYKTL